MIIAASRRGAVIVPVNSRFKAAEVGYVVENGMMYTSGTTSRPRGCVHSHATLLHEAAALASRLRPTADDRFWTPLPFFHVGGFDVLFSSLWARASIYHVGAFDPGTALQQLATERCTVAFPRSRPSGCRCSTTPGSPTPTCRPCGSSSTSGLPSGCGRCRLGCRRLSRSPARVRPSPSVSVASGRSTTAARPRGRRGRAPAEVRATTSGPVVDGMEARIVDPETGAALPDDTPGEFVFRGAVRFLRYHRDPALTAQRIDAEGWYHSGDVVVRDTEGRFTFVGRLGDRLKVGGENVAPAEVEDFLSAHPSVGIVQVVAAPDARYGEVPAAFVELRPGTAATEQELIDFCLDRIASLKVPRYVQFVDEWPMSGTKIQEFRLRERIAAAVAEGHGPPADRP